MRTAKISIDGRERLLCFSTRVMRACTERYGGVEKIDDVLSPNDPARALDETIWLMAAMMDAGARYARLNGLDNPEPLSFDDLYDATGIDDLTGLKGKIAETITNGRTPTLDAVPPKNGAATPDA